MIARAKSKWEGLEAAERASKTVKRALKLDRRLHNLLRGPRKSEPV